ncbi:MAG: hypothetical protein GF384_03000 [Elusimicrobia bacterium]|nr:hypothetical protein [Elusimicrobiota bacterium]
MAERKLIFTSYDHMEANVVQSYLESHEIMVFKTDEHISLMQPFARIAYGGIKLYVPEDQEQKAKELLEEHMPQTQQTGSHTGKLTHFTNPKAVYLIRIVLLTLLVYFIFRIIAYLR